MLTVHPASDRRACGGYQSMQENVRLDRFKVHTLVADPEEADLILFVEVDTGRLCEYVLRHPYIRRYLQKCFMFSTDWRVIPFIPGIYTSLEKSWYLPHRSRAGFYLSCLINPLIKFEPGGDHDLLYSFMGDVLTAPVRRVLSRLQHPRGAFMDTSWESQEVMWKGSTERREAFWDRYVELGRRSKFILCPRGLSPSSIRLFETMCMGRVPVILADEWVRPAGPQWDAFSIQVPEQDAGSVPRLLEEKEAEATEMGLRARAEWEKYYSPDIVFHRVVEMCLELQKSRRLPEALDRFSLLPQLFRPRVIREFARAVRQHLKEKIS